MKLAGLFSGIGGLESPLIERGASLELLCDNWDHSQRVLTKHHPDTPIVSDVAELADLPGGVEVLTAGFPCTDLSQAGLMKGINGSASGLVTHVFRLIRNHSLEWVVIENVKNMLALDRGRAMEVIVRSFEEMGFNWAYRTVDSRSTGVPQRRQRVVFVASRKNDPREVLFGANEEIEIPSSPQGLHGFYWTEGLSGIGWVENGVPPLKGGSTIGIPSPPAIWRPQAGPGQKIVTPCIRDAERMQGFPADWTHTGASRALERARWKLVGNAVSYGVGGWVADSLINPPGSNLSEIDWHWKRWPAAASGIRGARRVHDANEWPTTSPYCSLDALLTGKEAEPLSLRATQGFRSRTQRSKLRFNKAFLADVDQHIEVVLQDERCAA